MGVVNGCNVPQELFYNVESNVWARLESNNTVVVGMTAYACSLAGQIVSFTAKKIGKEVRQDKSLATVESGKWVGPVKAPVSGEIIEINSAVEENPGLINDDPYGQGWVVRMKVDDWDDQAPTLLTGEAALKAFAAKMKDDGFGGC